MAELTTDYLDRFGGVGRLFGREALSRLHAAHVGIVGVGGVGSWAVEALARSGVGRLTLIDFDDVCITNVNRQLPAVQGQIGRPKVLALAERMRLINPACEIEPVVEFLTPATAERLLSPTFDYVIDAVDRMSIKALIVSGCRARGRRVLSVGGAGGRRDPTQVRTGDIGESGDPLLRLVRKRLRREHGFDPGAHRGITRVGVMGVWSVEKPVFPWSDGTCASRPEPESNLKLDCESGLGTAMFVTAAFGLAAAGVVVRTLAAGE